VTYQARLRKNEAGWLLELLNTDEPAAWSDGDEVVVELVATALTLERVAAEAARAVEQAHDAVVRALGEAMPPPPNDQLPVDAAAAKAQLDLVLSFFTRVETKLSVVLAIDLAMLGLAFTKSLPLTAVHLGSGVGLGAFIVCQGWALLALYRGSFPELSGGHASLVYFREVAKLREADYTERFSALSKSALARDHLEQAWRNARILATKFDQIQRAYQWTALSIVPWAIALALLAAGAAS
jgi:hypothetical protein